jgi:hypothetical protein
MPCGSGTVENTLTTVIDDMLLPNEGHGHGVPPEYDWYDHATYQDLEAIDGQTLGTFHAVTPWGQVYEDATGNPSPTIRIQIRSLQGWVRRKASALPPDVTQSWEILEPGIVDLPDHGLFPEDMRGGATRPSDAYAVSDTDGGGLSGWAGDGWVFHFFPAQRAPLELSEVEAIFSTFEARLVRSNAEDSLSCEQARYLASSGIDAYTSTRGEVTIAPEVTQGRLRRVTTSWTWFNAWYAPGMDPAYLRAAPPPLNRRTH